MINRPAWHLLSLLCRGKMSSSHVVCIERYNLAYHKLPAVACPKPLKHCSGTHFVQLQHTSSDLESAKVQQRTPKCCCKLCFLREARDVRLEVCHCKALCQACLASDVWPVYDHLHSPLQYILEHIKSVLYTAVQDGTKAQQTTAKTGPETR